MKFSNSIWAAIIAGAFAFTGGGAFAQSPLGLGTHSVGSSFYAGGTAAADLITRNTDLRVIVQPAVSPTAYIPEINRGNLDLGIPSSMDAAWAFRGQTGYSEPQKNIRGLFRAGLFMNTAAVARSDAGIERLMDVAGHPVAAQFPGTLVFQGLITAELESVGLTWADVQAVPATDFAGNMAMLRSGQVDVGGGGAPDSPSLQELDQAVEIVDLPFGDLTPQDIANGVPEDMQAILDKHLPGSTLAVAPAGTGILTEDTVVVGYPGWLIASSELSEDAAYQILDTIWENYEELHPVHSWLATWHQDTMFDPRPVVPYHPGAVRFFKEKGLWTPEVEERQQELVSQAE